MADEITTVGIGVDTHRELQVQVSNDRQAHTAAALKAVNDNSARKDAYAQSSTENANDLLEELSRQRDAALVAALVAAICSADSR